MPEILAMRFSYNPKAMSEILEVEQVWLVDLFLEAVGRIRISGIVRLSEVRALNSYLRVN